MRSFTVIFAVLVAVCAARRIKLSDVGQVNDADLQDPAEVSLEDRLVKGLNDYIQTGVETEDFQNAIEFVRAPYALRSFSSAIKNKMVCILCNVAARVLITYGKIGGPKKLLVGGLKKLCTDAKIESGNVCSGVIDLNVDTFIYIIKNKPNLTPKKLCSIIAQPFGCQAAKNDDWSINIPPPLSNLPPVNTITGNEKPVRILQITDLHFDELYAPGANAVCGEPLCCGTNQGEPAKASDMAGTWGDYRSCDMPWYSVLELMVQVKKHDVDYMYYTGDIINHRVWSTTQESNMKNLKRTYSLFRKTFNNTPVFPILGNHEPNPLNVFAPDEVTEVNLTTSWLYDLAATEWAQWLPTSAQETIRKGGFYTVLVRPGFRVIALNSNVAYTFNWWLLYENKDPYGQLQWLSDTLYQAEKDGEIVHILSHVPTGDSTAYKVWSREFNKIIKRFSHVIGAQFVGHTHYDEMNMYYNNSNVMEPISIAFNGGSFTTYTNVNPNYRIYDVNSATWEVEDYEEWIYNLTEANKHSTHISPVWYKLYSFKQAYGLKSMKLSEMGQLIRNMANNQTLLDQYYRFKFREGDIAMENGCDQTCHEENLCNLSTTEFGESKICEELTTMYRSKLEKKNCIRC